MLRRYAPVRKRFAFVAGNDGVEDFSAKHVYSAIMNRPRFCVDFNELIESDLVALSASDEKLSSTGEKVSLHNGLLIDVYSDDDLDDKGEPDSLIASGVVERNSAFGWAEKIRWCCRIDAKGIRHQSEIGK